MQWAGWGKDRIRQYFYLLGCLLQVLDRKEDIRYSK